MATTALGRLTLDLAVRVSEFTDGMSRAARETAERTREMSDSVGKFKDNLVESLSGTPIGGAIDSLNEKLGSITQAFGEGGLAGAAKVGALAVVGAIAAMGAGLVTLALQTAESDQQLQRLAERGNTSTKNLQILTAATKAFGLEMDGVGDILADAQEKLGEFSATGGGGLADTLDLLQLKTKMTDAELEVFGKNLSTMDSVDAVQAIVNEMERAGATTQEVRFITESLASGLGDIIPLWDNNGAALDKYGEKLEENGIIRTKESMEQTKYLATEVNNLKGEYEGMSNEILTSTLPAMVGLIKYMKRGTEDANGLSSSMSSIGIIAAALATPVIGIMSVFKQLGTVIGGLMANTHALFSLISDVISSPFEIRNHLKNYTNAANTINYATALDMKKEKDKAVASLTDVWSSPQELANRRTAQTYADTHGTKRNIKTDFSNKSSSGIPYRPGSEPKQKAMIPYRPGERPPVITADRSIEKAATEASKSNTKALKDNTKAATSASKSSKGASELISKAVVGGKTYPTGDGGHFGASRNGGKRSHAGLDLSTPMGTQIYAPEGGRYTFANTPNGTGGRIGTLVGDSGKVYRFLHLLNSTIESGSRVSAGAPLAKTGNSGSRSGGKNAGKPGDGYATHLHLEVSQNGKKLNPKGLKTGGAVKYETGVASEYDKAASEEDREAQKVQDDAAREAKRIREEAERENDRRLAAGKDRVFKGLTQYEQIVAKSLEEEGLAMYELSDREEDLAKELTRIRTQKDNDLRDLHNKTFADFMTQEDKLIAGRDDDIIDIKSKYAEGNPERDIAIKAVLAKFDTDWEDLQWVLGEESRKLQEISDSISSSMGLSTNQALMQTIDSQARLNMSDKDYADFARKQGKVADYGSVDNDYNNRKSEINETDEKGKFLLDAEQRNQLLLDAHEEFLAKKSALDADYAVREKNIAQEKAMAKLDIEQGNVDALGNLAGVLLGQQSTAARAAFLVSKAYTLQKIWLDKGAAISSAWANTPGDNWAKAAAAAQAALANGAAADMINQVVVPTFSGIAHGGMDYIPSESTFLLDKGERVLSPRQNKDLTNFLSKGGTSSSTGETNINITIDNNGNSKMSNDNASEMSKQLALQIKLVVEQTLRKEQRQGGMLNGR